MSQEIKYTEDMVGNFRILGFATGSYNCTCMSEKSSHCAKHFIGDKRAFIALPARLKQWKRNSCRVQVPMSVALVLEVALIVYEVLLIMWIILVCNLLEKINKD
jgi:hypothetical protein